MGLKAIKSVRKFEGLSFRDRAILNLLAELVEDSDEEWISFPSIGYLSETAACSERTVKRALASLEGQGILEKEQGRSEYRGTFSSNRYRIHIGFDLPGATESLPGATESLPGATESPRSITRNGSLQPKTQPSPSLSYSANVGRGGEGETFGDLERSKPGVDSLGKAAPELESSETVKQVNGLKVQDPAAAAREPDPEPPKEDPGPGSEPLFDPAPNLSVLFPHIAEDEGIDWEDLDRKTAEALFKQTAPKAHAAWRTIVRIRKWDEDTCQVQLLILLDHLAEDHRDGFGNVPVTHAMQGTLKAGPQDMGLPQVFYCNQRKSYRKELLAEQRNHRAQEAREADEAAVRERQERGPLKIEDMDLTPRGRKFLEDLEKRGKAKLARRSTDALGPAGVGGTPTTDPDPAVKDTGRV